MTRRLDLYGIDVQIDDVYDPKTDTTVPFLISPTMSHCDDDGRYLVDTSPALFGSPSAAEKGAALVYLRGVLARLGMLAARTNDDPDSEHRAEISAYLEPVDGDPMLCVDVPKAQRRAWLGYLRTWAAEIDAADAATFTDAVPTGESS